MSQHIDEQIKAAERDKLLLEVEKLRIEKEKLRHETRALEKANNRRWWQKSETWKPFVAIFLGIGILSFYIVYIVDPLTDYKNKLAASEGLDTKIQYQKFMLDQAIHTDSLYKLISGSSQRAFRKSFDSSLVRQQKKHASPHPLPALKGTWLSSLYNGMESWEIETGTDTNTYKVILKTPDGMGDGLAVYNGKGVFVVNLHFQGTKRTMQLEYTWIPNDVNPNAINSSLYVKESKDPSTPSGTRQSDILFKKVLE